MEIYIAICIDRHVDEDIKVFTDSEKAIEYAKDFVPEGYDILERELTEKMKQSGWIYLANYGVEGDHVRVEVGQFDLETDIEIKKLRDATTHWNGYGWKDGVYVDDLDDYFSKIKEEIGHDQNRQAYNQRIQETQKGRG